MTIACLYTDIGGEFLAHSAPMQTDRIKKAEVEAFVSRCNRLILIKA
jgi:hypothetical protein